MTWRRPTTSSTQRGYDTKHRALRAKLLPSAYGTPCVRCGQVMLPTQQLHLDHTDTRTGYLGFSHADCNMRAAARKARRNQLIRKRIRKQLTIMDDSRQW